MTYGYLRYSTSHQDEVQQRFALDEYASSHGLTIDDLVKDEGISGGVSYRDRNLYKLVRKMKPGDVLITTEISRLGRAMSDISKLLNDELKPKKIRLVVIKMGIDIDCSNMKARDDFLFSALSFAAQIEKEMLVQRTQSALDARKALIEKDGGFVSKAGNFCTKLGNKKGCDMSAAVFVSNQNRKAAKEEWRRTGLFLWVENQLRKGRPRREIVAEAREMYEKTGGDKNWATRRGCPLSEALLSIWAKDILPPI